MLIYSRFTFVVVSPATTEAVHKPSRELSFILVVLDVHSLIETSVIVVYTFERINTIATAAAPVRAFVFIDARAASLRDSLVERSLVCFTILRSII